MSFLDIEVYDPRVRSVTVLSGDDHLIFSRTQPDGYIRVESSNPRMVTQHVYELSKIQFREFLDGLRGLV